MADIAAQPILKLYRDAASTEPAPGGGSVTALCGMLGLALVLKALRISLKRREDAAEHLKADRALEALAAAMAEDADADVQTFTAFIEALRLPRGTPEEAAERSRLLEDAAFGATDAGLGALEHAQDAMRRARALAPLISRTMAPDLEAGLALLEVMRLNAVHNAEANIAGVKTPARHEALSQRLDALR